MNTKTDVPIRILIVDDHPVVRAGLSSMLGTQANLEIAGSASGGAEALAILELIAVDVLLLDLRMPGMDGIEMLQSMARLKKPPRAIVLTNYEMDEDVYRAVQAGAQGYLLKDTSQQEMINAIKAVHGGKRYLPQHIASRLAERMMRSTLSGRETEILNMLAKGFTNKEIGRVLEISEHTVRSHVNSILEKLEVSDRTEAATAGILRGIIHPVA